MHVRTNYSWLLLLPFVSVFSTCIKALDCSKNKHSFLTGIKAYPDKDSISIGDTIYFEFDEPITLTDRITNQAINYSNAANLGTAIGFAEFIAPNQTNTIVAERFKYHLIVGREIKRPDSSRFKEYNFSEISSRYKFKLAIIPQQKGVFKLFFSNAENVYRTTDKCTKAFFTIDFMNTNQHLYLNEVSFPGNIPLPGGGIYLFKVK